MPSADGQLAYSGVGARIEVLEVDEEGTPRQVFETEPLVPLLRDSIFDLERTGSLLVASLHDRVVLLDLVDPRRPRPVGEMLVARGGLSLMTSGSMAAVLSGSRDPGVLIDLSDPSAPRELGGLDLPGGERDLDFAPDGRHLYVIAASEDLQRRGVPWVVDISDPLAPEPLWPIDPEIEDAMAMAVDETGGLLWLAEAGNGRPDARDGHGTTWLRAYDLADPGRPMLRGEVILEGARVFRLRALGGRAYVGTWTSTGPMTVEGHVHVVGLVDGEPGELARASGAGMPNDVAPLAGGRIVAVHDLGLTVFGPDQGGPSDPPGASRELPEVGRLGGPGWWKNVATVGDRVYLSGSHTLQVIDVGGDTPSERGLIHTLGERRNLLNGRGKGLAIDDGAVILANRNRSVLQTIDVSDPDAPREVGRFSSNSTLSFEPEAVVAREGFAYVAGMDIPLLVLDVADRALPAVAAILPDQPGLITGGWTVAVSGDRIYASGPYTRTAVGERLVAVDIGRRQEPEVIGSLEVPGDRPRIRGIDAVGDLVVASVESRDGGRLRVADFSDPAAPIWLPGTADIGDEPHVLAYHPPLAYVLGYPMGLAVFDLSDPSAPRELDRLPELAGGYDVAVGEDGRIYVAADSGGLVTVLLEGAGEEESSVFLPRLGRH